MVVRVRASGERETVRGASKIAGYASSPLLSLYRPQLPEHMQLRWEGRCEKLLLYTKFASCRVARPPVVVSWKDHVCVPITSGVVGAQEYLCLLALWKNAMPCGCQLLRIIPCSYDIHEYITTIHGSPDRMQWFGHIV